MPFKSQAQSRKFCATADSGEISRGTVRKRQRHTGGKDLTEKVGLALSKQANLLSWLRGLKWPGRLGLAGGTALAGGAGLGAYDLLTPDPKAEKSIEPEVSLIDRWNQLPLWAQIALGATGAAGVGGLGYTAYRAAKEREEARKRRKYGGDQMTPAQLGKMAADLNCAASSSPGGLEKQAQWGRLLAMLMRAGGRTAARGAAGAARGVAGGAGRAGAGLARGLGAVASPIARHPFATAGLAGGGYLGAQHVLPWLGRTFGTFGGALQTPPSTPEQPFFRGRRNPAFPGGAPGGRSPMSMFQRPGGMPTVRRLTGTGRPALRGAAMGGFPYLP